MGARDHVGQPGKQKNGQQRGRKNTHVSTRELRPNFALTVDWGVNCTSRASIVPFSSTTSKQASGNVIFSMSMTVPATSKGKRRRQFEPKRAHQRLRRSCFFGPLTLHPWAFWITPLAHVVNYNLRKVNVGDVFKAILVHEFGQGWPCFEDSELDLRYCIAPMR